MKKIMNGTTNIEKSVIPTPLSSGENILDPYMRSELLSEIILSPRIIYRKKQ